MAKTKTQEMVENFDRLMYMIKTTAPHLQPFAVELRDSVKQAMTEAEGGSRDVQAKPPRILPPAK